MGILLISIIYSTVTFSYSFAETSQSCNISFALGRGGPFPLDLQLVAASPPGWWEVGWWSVWSLYKEEVQGVAQALFSASFPLGPE